MIRQRFQLHAARCGARLLAVVLLMGLTACPPGPGSGGITVPQSDATPPQLSLGAGQPNGQNVTVSSGGGDATMNLNARTGVLNLLATANDPESGIQTVQIWIETKTTTCQAAGPCSSSGPGLNSQPTYESTSPAKHPGDSTSASSILAEALDLATTIPQGSAPSGGSLSVSLIMWAVAANNLGGRTQTPTLTATFCTGRCQ
jgi:hypothetical protein